MRRVLDFGCAIRSGISCSTLKDMRKYILPMIIVVEHKSEGGGT